MKQLVATGITTAPRQSCYLKQTLETLLPQTGSAHIFAEPGSTLPLPNPDIHVHQNAVRLGNWHNWLRMCHWLLENTPEPFILTAEDDVTFAEDAVPIAVEFIKYKHPAGFVSLYTSGKYAKLTADNPAIGIRQLKISRLWGACAWLFQRKSLARIVSHPLARSWQGNDHDKTIIDRANANGVDIAVGKILNDLKLSMYFAVPSLAEHIGEHSTVGNNEGLTIGRRALGFVMNDK